MYPILVRKTKFFFYLEGYSADVSILSSADHFARNVAYKSQALGDNGSLNNLFFTVKKAYRKLNFSQYLHNIIQKPQWGNLFPWFEDAYWTNFCSLNNSKAMIIINASILESVYFTIFGKRLFLVKEIRRRSKIGKIFRK